MKQLIAIATVMVTALWSGTSAGQTTPQEQRQGRRQLEGSGQPAGPAPVPVKKLTRAELDALLTSRGQVLLLDVRRPDELQSIGGFPVYLSIQSADVEKYLAFIPKDWPIVTVSNHANRAQRAAGLLEKNGFSVAGAIGAQDYESEGGTLVKIAAPPPRR